MPDNSLVRVELEMSEIIASYVFATQRKLIDEGGAKSIFDQFGGLRVVVNDHAVLALHLHEDEHGLVVLDVIPILDGKPSTNPFRIDLEERGIVPARTRTRKQG